MMHFKLILLMSVLCHIMSKSHLASIFSVRGITLKGGELLNPLRRG